MSIPDDKVNKAGEAMTASRDCGRCGHSKVDHSNGNCSKCQCLAFE